MERRPRRSRRIPRLFALLLPVWLLLVGADQAMADDTGEAITVAALALPVMADAVIGEGPSVDRDGIEATRAADRISAPITSKAVAPAPTSAPAATAATAGPDGTAPRGSRPLRPRANPPASPVLDLAGPASRFDAWDVTTALLDPGRRLTLSDALGREADFVYPDVPRANLGPRPESVWMRIPVRADTSGRWVFEIDYPPLNRVEAWVVAEGEVVQHALMGSDLPAAERTSRSRAHIFFVDLQAGVVNDIMLKIDSETTVVTPIRLHREAAFIGYESQRMLLLGLMFGATLLLIAMTTVNGVTLRDPAFYFYGLMLIGVSMFFVSFSGLGHQFLWSAQTGYLEKISPIGALLALSAASFFVIAALDMTERSPRLARCLKVAAGSAMLATIAAAVGLLDYRQASLAATVLGPIQIVLALVESSRQAWRGSRVAMYMMLGWGAYAIGSLSLALLLRGLISVDFLTQNLFQFSSLVEMIAWMRVLALRIEVIRQDIERVAAEKQALHALAHSDALTGLLNRRGFVLAIQNALASARPPFGVYLIDLDGFKAVNDRLGHEAGDETLVHVAKRLRAVLREGDVVARLGGDEFVVLAWGVPNRATAQMIGRKMLDAIGEPFELSDRRPTAIGATIGYALAPDDGNQADVLLRAADAAMYAGKSAGRQTVRHGSDGAVAAEPGATPGSVSVPEAGAPVAARTDAAAPRRASVEPA